MDAKVHTAIVRPVSQRLPISTRNPAPMQRHLRRVHINNGRANVIGKRTLSGYLDIGRQYHGTCRGAWVERRHVGYYHYEVRYEWDTCALAAAYAGLKGPRAVERLDFSASAAIWRLSDAVGVDLINTTVYGPTGRLQNVACELIDLVDVDYWTRDDIVYWLKTIKL